MSVTRENKGEFRRMSEFVRRYERDMALKWRRSKRWCAFSVTFSALLCFFAMGSNTANAQELDPAVYILIDTSGSMLQTVDGAQYTYGDGSLEHPHYDSLLESRMYMAKNAISTVVNAYGEVMWGMARFEQMSGRNYLCMCSDEIPNNTSGCGGYGGLWAPEDECRLCDVMADYPDYDIPGVHDRVCINYGGGLFDGCTDPISGLPLLGADILVALGGDTKDWILSWVDHSETDPGDPDYDTNLAPEDQVNPELRAVGGTPLGGALFDIYDQLSWEIGSDDRRGCRPYSVILLTDGAEECGTDPIAAADELLMTPDLQHTCTTTEDCPLNSVCSGGHCRYEVKTHVIAFAVSDQEFLGCQQIGVAGNTGGAIPAESETEIVSAMAGIIASSIVMELCNGIDDNCNGLTDEDYPDLGDTCDNGLLGQCYCSGTMVCTADEVGTECSYDAPSETNPCGSPTEEVCNDLDDNCDGITDNVDPNIYPDGCDPPPDLCDPNYPENEGLDDPRVGQVCGTDEGECQTGITICVQGEIVCDGEVAPQPEECDGLDNNCNGLTDEGLARQCYVTRDGYPEGCVYDAGTETWNCVGACRTGIQVCNDGSWGDCQGYVNEKDEVCNNADDNCNGDVDENLSQTCQETNGWGTCNGTETCSAGSWEGCDASTPAEEVCDGVDNNCDGITDMISEECYIGGDGCTYDGGTQTWSCVGECRTGSRLCVDGTFGDCQGARGAMPELCNNLDDSCDGLTDRDEHGNPLTDSCYSGPPGTEGVGECTAGARTCNSGSWSGCEGEVTPTAEMCDGLDNNCNGDTDEGLGQTTCGLGECEKTIDNCVNGVSQECDPFEGASPEICDGLDNDCNGITDGIIESCYTLGDGCVYDAGTETWQCEGVCAAGIRRCATPQQGGTGDWGGCEFQQGPVGEICDGLDNNCNGETDENLSQTCQETNGWGTCTGSETCVAGSWEGCDAATPEEEVCDGEDNNCDGITDMISVECYDTVNHDGCTYDALNDTWVCVGECRTGTKLCVDGSFGECGSFKAPTPELCNGLDDNCDGMTDTDENGDPLTETCYTGPPGTEGVGECKAGVRTCTNGVWGGCAGEVTTTAEVCDGLDNNCNGDTDEGLGQTTCGLGECEKTVDNCVNGVPQDCDPMEGASPEMCDGLDNNCDGITDGLIEVCYTQGEGCGYDADTDTWSCEGECTTGIRRCPTPAQGGTGTWGGCEYQQGPVDEVCDGRDNNCNGLTDEDENGDPLSQACYPPGSGPDTGCIYDEVNDLWTCEGICEAGERLCVTGAWEPCSGQVTPQGEVCNNLDDNCDGQTDEAENMPALGQPCGSAVGRCTQGTLQCIEGQEVCEGGEGPFEGECNGMDDNCDGVIDDPDEVAHLEGEPCGNTVGECEPGETKCVGGEIVCVGGKQPTEESCNGLDDDCDGEIDNGAVCPPNSYCYDGACRPVCDPGDEFGCPPNTDCTNVYIDEEEIYLCLPTVGECGGETCPDGWICVDEECVDPCEGVECEPWEECRQGVCMDQSCTAIGIDCPAGQFCSNHECVDDPCLGADCDPQSEYCVRDCDESECTYECASICMCPPGERCTPDAECVEDLCSEVNCTSGNVCNGETGECEPDECFNVTCAIGKKCYEGECIDDPCADVVCPPFNECHLVDTGDTGVKGQCRPDPSYWDPGSGTTEIIATGKGGCGCRVTGGKGPAGKGPLTLLLLLLLIVGWRGRKAVREESSGRRSLR